MKAKLIATINKSWREDEEAMSELSRDKWEIIRNTASLDIDIPCAFKVGDCISFSMYWGDIESIAYNARLGMFEYYFVFDKDSILEL